MPEHAVAADARDDPSADEPATQHLVRPGTGNAGRFSDRDA
ncbi:MAG TPA: hypothetical protein VF302_02855 [Candidatus Limnocylindrales bacterium]